MKNFIILFILFQVVISNKSNINLNIDFKNMNETDRQITFNSSNKKNLIISTLIRFKWKKILPFIKSLIKANLQNYDIVIFVKDVKASIIHNLKSFGIKVYEISEKFENIIVYDYRWKVYNDFLMNNRGKYKFILSMDLKDSIIQKDIFTLYRNKEHFLGFSYEHAPQKDGFTGKRILDIFGTELFEKIKNEKIINAGIVWGTENEIFKFSQILWEKLLIYPQADDQCILNYLYYHEKIFRDPIIFSDKDGPVITIGLTHRDHINLDSEDNILNSENQIASIVHQYDRHKDIQIKIKEKYCPEFIYSNNYFINTIYFFIFLEMVTIILSIKIIKFIFFQKIINHIISN